MPALFRLGLAAALLAALAVPASAQISVGAKAGLNTAFFSGDDADLTDDGENDASPRLGFVGGLTGRFPLNPTVALQLEALYAQKGGVYENSRGVDEVTKLDYLEIPASVRFGVPLSPLLDAGVSVGGYVGVPLRGRIEVDGDRATDPELNTDYGALVGVDVGSGPFYLEGRYALGLTDAIDFDEVLGDDVDKKNQVVSFTLGYRFGGAAPRGRRY